MLFDNPADLVDLLAAEAVASLQPDRIEPEFYLTAAVFYVNVRWFAAVAAVKEETIWPYTKYGRHVSKQLVVL
jgi:hypothetical protein